MKIIPAVLVLVLISSACKEKNKDTVLNEETLENHITLENNENDKQVNVLVDGKLFTSYIYTDDISVLKKTTLYPIIAANGEAITRGYPINSRPNERTDHPHHIGAWFNYGDVNGLDFWNNSDAISENQIDQMGTIRHEKVVDMKDGVDKAELSVVAKWLKPDGSALLNEETKFIFYAQDGQRIIDRIATLKALDEPILFKDNKEGMIAIRTARELEHPSDKPVTLSDVQGNETDVPVLDNTGVSGHYLSSNGVEGEDVWGKRAEWVALYGTIKNKDLTIVMMDEPKNVGYPTYWHARGYGLFAANPLGQNVFSDGKEELNFTLAPGESVTFSYRIAIFDGNIGEAQIESAYGNFVGN
ncbi:hypothetical protein D9O36_02195 [Zobellia amurskyensis]|uniref:Methane monooxygenase PmoA-like n=1 Tax=Zobellia amurskyensis TaxID=248905 RepID=A0A7X3D0I0_9FLAO|nr:PmoA family protein [Zobellia amurskyensis]MUH34640.1 hypothetical protein [Zobellia amurskyensis]